MGLLRDAFYRATRAAAARFSVPVPERLLATVDHAIAAAEHTAVTGAHSLVKLAELAATEGVASWRPSPPTTTVTQIIPTNVTTWSVGDVDAALTQHELGQFIESTGLMDAMGRDDRVKGCLDTRVRALAGKSGVGFSLEPSQKGDPKRAETFAKEVHDLWYYACPESVMTRILRDAVMLGVAVARIHWELIDGKRVPRLEPWDLRGVYWDWSIRRYRAIAMEGIFTIDPYSAEWLIFEPAGYRSWMHGAIRVLGRPWVVRKMTFRDWARYSEKHGMPMLAIKEPTGHQWERHKQGFWGKMKALGAEATLRLPTDGQGNGFDVDLIEATARSEQAFELLIKRLDTNVAVALLGQNLSTEVQGGSFAAAQAHNLIRLDYLDADAQTLSTALREQVWKAYLRFNYPEASEEETPWPTWETRPATDRKAEADVFSTVVNAIAAGAEKGVNVPAKYVQDTFDIPLTVSEPPPPPDAREASAGGDAPDGDEGDDDSGAEPALTALAVDPDALDAAYTAWRAAVNMSASELEAWAENPASRLASVDPAAVIERNLRLLRKPKGEWDARDVRDAKRTASFVARMRKMPRGKPARKGMPSKRDISLRNWAHDPSK